jgi:hypothetical protein
MLETASEMRCRGPGASFAVGGEFDGVLACDELVSGEFCGEIASFGWVPGSSCVLCFLSVVGTRSFAIGNLLMVVSDVIFEQKSVLIDATLYKEACN